MKPSVAVLTCTAMTLALLATPTTFAQSTNINPEFEITLSSGLPPLTVFFDSSSTTVVDGNAEGLSYVWTFADGSTAEGIEVAKTFNRAGEMDVLLTVSDGNAQAQVQKTIIVQTPENADGTLTMRPEEGYVISKHGVVVMSINDALEETINITIEEIDLPEEVLDPPHDEVDIKVVSPIYRISSNKSVQGGSAGQGFGIGFTVPEGVNPARFAVASVVRGEYSLPPLPFDFWFQLEGTTYLPDQSIVYISFSGLYTEPERIVVLVQYRQWAFFLENAIKTLFDFRNGNP